ncbi:MAG: BolA/IbaG family iron-sulfur metabolism protein [Candidatus Caenarcaniphilales bacterium]|jgi:stress-induced morphogen|nr:BolA/IbaG family iron-sulfur metabolism protein [Candidatus Caenarcaniphilales bacterium]
MALRAHDIEDLLKRQLTDVKEVEAIDLKGGNHWQVNITAGDFDGLNRVKREQLVQKVLKDLLADETIHALVVKAKNTEEK